MIPSTSMGMEQLQVQRRAARGLGYSLAYTLSRTMDDGISRLEILPNAYDDSGYYSRSGLDRPHILITQANYRTPTLESAPAVLRGVLGTGTSAAYSRRSRARRST